MNKRIKVLVCIIAAIAIALGGVVTGEKIANRRNREEQLRKSLGFDETEIVTEKTSAKDDKTENTKSGTTTTTAEPLKKSSKKNKQSDYKFVDPTEEDWFKLGTYEGKPDSLVYSWPPYIESDKEYNSKNLTSKDILQGLNMLGWISTYDLYFGDPMQMNYVDQPDPLKKYAPQADQDDFKGIYYKYPVENINWMMKYIYNVEPEIIKDFDDSTCMPYYHEGYYYFNYPMGGDACNPTKIIPEESVRLSDGRYKVFIKINPNGENEDNYETVAEMIVGLKLIDGVRYWSLYECRKLN